MPTPSPAAAPQDLVVLGSTGSIGTQTLDLVRLFPDRLRVRALTAHRDVEGLARQAAAFRPDVAAIADAARADALRRALDGTGVRVLAGPEGVREAAELPSARTVVAAIVGFAGLDPVLAALRAGKKVALANKETLVVAGALVTEAVRAHGGVLLPVDSEHSAIFQCLVGEPAGRVDRLVLTASGGPFRTLPAADFDAVTPERALRHPNWDMGAKITIDSATMMNKGLEVIEARWLFDVPADRIDVLVHPGSIVHSLVVFSDGSMKAQLGVPDMRVPIQYALSYPDRWPAPHPRADLAALGTLAFEAPDLGRFPCLGLAYEALRRGGTAPAVLNAANEVAVASFLKEEIRFTDIPRVIEAAVDRLADPAPPSRDALEAADAEARRLVRALRKELHPARVD